MSSVGSSVKDHVQAAPCSSSVLQAKRIPHPQVTWDLGPQATARPAGPVCTSTHRAQPSAKVPGRTLLLLFLVFKYLLKFVSSLRHRSSGGFYLLIFRISVFLFFIFSGRGVARVPVVKASLMSTCGQGPEAFPGGTLLG